MSVILFDQTSYNNFPIFCLRCDWFNVWFLSRPEIIFSLSPLWSRRTLRKSSKEPTRWVYILFLSSSAYYLTLSRAVLNIIQSITNNNFVRIHKNEPCKSGFKTAFFLWVWHYRWLIAYCWFISVWYETPCLS